MCIDIVADKLVVKKFENQHNFHNLDENTYKHYPENMRLTTDEKKTAVDMIKVGANKQKMKQFLTEKRGADGSHISLKHLHNLHASTKTTHSTGLD